MKSATAYGTTRRAAQVLCILLLLVLLSALLLSQIYRSDSAVGREKIAAATYARVQTHEGYLFRDEQTVVEDGNNGAVEYLVANGQSVAAGAELARVFTDSSGTNKRAVAAELYDEIERLERALQNEKPWQAGYLSSYESMMCALGGGDWRGGVAASRGLADSLEQRGTVADRDAARARIDELRGEVAELLLHEDEPSLVTASAAGYFHREVDGYEALFGTAALDGLTPEKLDDLIGARIAPSEHTVGKLVLHGAFYLAVPLSASDAAVYRAGMLYEVRFSGGNVLRMRLESVTPSPDGSEAVLVLGADRSPTWLEGDRRQTVGIVTGSVRGLCVPYSALEEKDGEHSVYVVLDGVARRRRVQVLCTEGGSALVLPTIEEEYLREGEFVLITLRNIYDGKVLYR